MRLHEEIEAARKGDRRALDLLLARANNRLQKLTEGRMGPSLRSRVRTSDVLQSTYLQVIRGVAEFEGETEEAFVSWVAQILDNNIRQKLRFFGAKKRQEPDTFRADQELRQRAIATPSAEACRAEDILLASQALDALSEDHRQVILLRLVEGKSHGEIADVMGRPVTATRMLLSRARAALSLEIERLDATTRTAD